MKRKNSLGQIRTNKNIRTYYSIRTNTGPGQAAWPRLKETEQLQFKEKRLNQYISYIWR